MPWIGFDEWLAIAEKDLDYRRADLDDYVPEWRRRLQHPELFPTLEELD